MKKSMLVVLFVLSGCGDSSWIPSKAAGVSFMKAEVTVAQYSKCVDAGKCENTLSANDTGCNWNNRGREGHPMNCITWEQAKAVCAYLGGRLPTPKEWTAEASNGDTYDWPWGKEPMVSCDYAIGTAFNEGQGCGKNSTWPVCSKPKGNSVSGLCDMSGNVEEWLDFNNGGAAVGGSYLNVFYVTRHPSFGTAIYNHKKFMAKTSGLVIAGGESAIDRGVRCVAKE